MNEHSNNIFQRGQIADVGSKGINVLSLFNGMSTGHTALDNVGIKVNKYYSSELKPYAIKLTQHHYPETIQLGDVNNWREWDIDWKSIDLLLSGSPCQDLSSMGSGDGLKGKKSSLFFVFIEILEHIKKVNPNVIFFQENVGSASRTDIGIMSRAMGVYPVRINSNLLTAQNRDRYYWTNARTKEFGMFGDLVTDIPQPKDKCIVLNDILTSGESKEEKHKALMHRMYYSFGHKDKKSKKAQGYIFKREKFGNTVIYEEGYVRLANKTELCRLQGFPDNWCDILSLQKAASLLGDGWTLPIIEHIFQYLPFKKAKGKCY